MENHSPSLQQAPASTRAEIDTTRAFSSVREAVAVLGERILASDVYTPKSPTIPKHVIPAPPKVSFSSPTSTATCTPTQLNQEKEEDSALANLVKRLEAELEETKRELKQLKERESETEIALASLNAELHKSMSRMAEAEAVEAGRAAARSGLIVGGLERDGGGGEEEEMECGARKSESSSLAHILSIGEKEGYFGTPKTERKVVKKKPIVPLIGEMFSRKKSSFSLYNPLFGRSHAY